MSSVRSILWVLMLCTIMGAPPSSAEGQVGLGDPDVWSAHPADGVKMTLGEDQGALRLDYAFAGGGWAIARRDVDLDLPDNYAFRFLMRGAGPANNLEFKLVDDSGENVWWHVARDVDWPDDWQRVTISRRRIRFAWGPAGGGDIRHAAAIEFAVTATGGGSGTVWIRDLEMVPLPPRDGPPPPLRARADSEAPGHPGAAAVDGDSLTWWAPAGDGPSATLILDPGRNREFSGLGLVWKDPSPPRDYVLEAADEGSNWRELARIDGAVGVRDEVFLPEKQGRLLRLTVSCPVGSDPPAVREVDLHPVEWAESRNDFFMRLAARARPGLYPRGFLGLPSEWTVVGADRDDREGLISFDGAVDAGPGSFSLEPFLSAGGRLLTWRGGSTRCALVDGDLPLPLVIREWDGWRLRIAAMAPGEANRSFLMVAYTLHNTGTTTEEASLDLAIRPFQVNPPSQSLNQRGGTARIGALEGRGKEILIDGRLGVRFFEAPDAFGAATFAGKDAVAYHLARGRLPAARRVSDPFGAASGIARFTRRLAPGDSLAVTALIPLHPDIALPREPAECRALARRTEDHWRRARDRVVLEGPAAMDDFLDTIKAQLGWVLVNRATVGFQPGARSYARSWIRDGAMTGDALLRLGHFDEVRDFIDWYADYQYPDGKIPCVVDRRGADPVPEHDSTGEFIHLVVQYCRYTGDTGVLAAMWPRIKAGVGYLEGLIATRRTEAFRVPDKREFFGILPPSISHEGYAAKPMHSYWDDFWALRGFKDAALAAKRWPEVVGGTAASDHRRFAALRDTFAADLHGSITAAMARHGIDYVPGCADLGDFDATSTTIALDPAAAGTLLPGRALQRTFSRYWEFFSARRDGEPWDAFTPYEVRTIGSAVRLGWRERARELLDFFMAHRSPPGWRQWPEVVVNDTLKARFIGDMPHTWVGSDFIRSGLDMLAYELRDEEPGGPALVLAAGVPRAWVAGPGIRVGSLPTPYGPLSYTLVPRSDGLEMHVAGGIAVPAGGLLLDPPATGLEPAGKSGTVARDGQGRVIIRSLPATVVWAAMK